MIKYQPKVNDVIKFKDNLWKDKKELGLGGGLFGKPISIHCKNKFIINSVKNIGNPRGSDDIELGLIGYPWLVWIEEIELIKE